MAGYNIETKLCSKAGWFTPSEARNYYGRYARNGITVHWWGGGERADKHDSIVNYFLAQAKLGNKSVNYVVSDKKITMMVTPDNVAWASQSGNPTTVSIEFQPTLGAEGYKKGGWLIWQLELRYKKGLNLYKHSQWFATQCPGSVSPTKLRAEANKWRAGKYNPVPAKPQWQANLKTFPKVIKYTLSNAKLVDVNTLVTKQSFKLDTPISVTGETKVNNREFWLSEYSVSNKQPNGFLKSDLKAAKTPPKVTPPVQSPAPIPEVPAPPAPIPPVPTVEENVNWLVKAVKAILGFFKIKV